MSELLHKKVRIEDDLLPLKGRFIADNKTANGIAREDKNIILDTIPAIDVHAGATKACI